MSSWLVKLTSVLVVVLAFRWLWRDSITTDTFLNKNVVICGASAGIGEEVAYRFSEQGANVLLVARREEALKRVVNNCSSLGASSASFVVADLSTIEGVQLVVQEASKRLKTVDVLVLNHVLYDVERWHGDRNLRDVTSTFNTNVISYINLGTLFLPSLRRSRGRMVVLSSGLGLFTYPYFTLYCANKHALHGFFNALRQDLALEETGDGEGVSITISVLGATVTENALNVSKGNPVAGEKGWTRGSPVDASRALLQATLRRDRQMYYPSLMRLHEIASFHFPVFTEKLIRYTYGLNG